MSAADSPMLTVVSIGFPPMVSGSSILMANLLSNYTGRVRAISGYGYYEKLDVAFLPPCPTRYLFLPRMFPRAYQALRWRLPALIYRSIYPSIRRLLAKRDTSVVLAAFPYDDYLVATFLAARHLKLPFYAYMHDLWIENMPSGSAAARFAQRWEPVILRESTRVLCMTEAMQKHYETKYRIRTELLPHSIPEEDCLNAPAEMFPPQLSRPTVLFVGNVNVAMNLDSLNVLARASELLPPEYDLIFCTSLDVATLARLGIRSNRLKVKYMPRQQVRRLQSEVHVLIAPLSHKNCSIDEVRTVFSTKLLEYLVSGRPIVVFAPEGSYHAELAAKNGWGYVVTEDSPVALAAAIVKVVTDHSLAGGLVRAALREARSRNAESYATQLRDWVVADSQNSPVPVHRLE